MYMIGIDGGGSYSRLVAVDKDMKIIGRHAGSSTNISANSHEKVLEHVKKLLNEFNRLSNTDLSDCIALCIGSAGVDVPENGRQMEGLLREAGVSCPVRVVNDAELILATETKGEPGIAIISGTGSIGYAVGKDGKGCRAGGWGYLIDDGGSGYWIGMRAIQAAFKAHDGRGPATILTEKIMAHFKIKTIEDVLHYTAADHFNKAQIAELALLVKYAADEKDIAAMEIEKAAAGELCALAKALIGRTGMKQAKVVLSGSVLLLNESIQNMFQRQLKKDHPQIQLIRLTEKPEIGAAYLARKLIVG